MNVQIQDVSSVTVITEDFDLIGRPYRNALDAFQPNSSRHRTLLDPDMAKIHAPESSDWISAKWTSRKGNATPTYILFKIRKWTY